MDKTSLGDRMKGYEAVPKLFLIKRTPVIIRLDGSHFHSFTRGFNKPFDNVLVKTMQDTMKYLCENVHGCVLGYTQSDEITLVLCDYKHIDSQGWFNYNLEKIVSTSASMATLEFNRKFENNVEIFIESDYSNYDTYEKAKLVGATFDSRAFNLPKGEVVNCLLWRQRDATRNSIQSLAQTLYSHKELQGINTNKLQDKMFTEKGINWNDLPTTYKRGSCCVKDNDSHKWVIDNNIPIFSEDRDYINSRITFD